MSKIAEVAGNAEDVKYYKASILALIPFAGFPPVINHLYYQNISEVYISKWEGFAISRDGSHAKLAYDWYGSWTTLYNLYADSLLCFHLEDRTPSAPSSSLSNSAVNDGLRQSRSENGFVPQYIYKIQSDWYHAVRQRYGLPLDSRHLQAKTDWEFFAAAVTSKSVRQEILQSVALWINETTTGILSSFASEV